MTSNRNIDKNSEKSTGERVALSDSEKIQCLFKEITLAVSCPQVQQDDKLKGHVATTPDLEELSISDKMYCLTCDISFLDRDQQVLHYQSDWHRFNIKQKLRGQKAISEDVFVEITEDISSISGSDTDSDEDKFTVNSIINENSLGDNEEESFHVEGIGRRHPRVFFRNVDDQLISVYRSVLYGKRNQPESREELIHMAANLHKEMKWVVLMVAGGHFAAAVFQGDKVITHKTFHRYVVRAKRGTVQSAHDNRGGHAKSAGAFMRRHHEAALFEDISKLVTEWSEHMTSCDRIFLRASGSNRNTLFSGKSPILFKKDPRIRLIPFPTRRPTFNEVKRVHSQLILVHCHDTDSVILSELSPKKSKSKLVKVPVTEKESTIQKNIDLSENHEEASSSDVDVDLVCEDYTNNTVDLQPFECVKKTKKKKKYTKLRQQETMKEVDNKEKCVLGSENLSEIQPLKDFFYGLRNDLYTAAKTGDCDSMQSLVMKLSEICDKGTSVQEVLNEPIDKGGGTLLHVASTSGHPSLIKLLLGAGSDPTTRNNSGQFAYVVTTDKATKNAFRRFMAEYPDKYNYTIAQVPGPLTKEMEEEKRTKEAEKRKAQKKAKKEKMKLQKGEEKKINKEKEEQYKFLSLSDREKRALAAERRLAAQILQKDQTDAFMSRCFQCAQDMTGKVPFEYSDNKFCSTKCLQQHRKTASQR